MKADIHPKYYPNATVTCACGNTFTVSSTKEKIEVEVCSACHPFYTGDTSKRVVTGQVEKFKARSAVASTVAKAKADKAAAKEKKTEK